MVKEWCAVWGKFPGVKVRPWRRLMKIGRVTQSAIGDKIVRNDCERWMKFHRRIWRQWNRLLGYQGPRLFVHLFIVLLRGDVKLSGVVI